MSEEISKHVLKTGTVTLGIVCKDGIVVAADRRQSYGGGAGVAYFAGEAKKIIELNNRMIATTAGNASDTRKILELIKAELRIKELRTKDHISIKETANFLANIVFQNIRTPSMIPSVTHFFLAGYDETGSQLFEISPDGYIQHIKTYSATGGLMFQATPILDKEYKETMSMQEGIELAKKCLEAASGRDPSVGAGMNIYTISKDSMQQVIEKKAVVEYKDK